MNNGIRLDETYTSGQCYPGEKSTYDIWTRGNVAEAFPDVMTPLSWSLWSDTMNELLRNAFRNYSFSREVKKRCFIMLKNGKLYYNIGLVNYYMKRIGLFSMDNIIGGETAYELEDFKAKVNWFKFFIHMIGNIKSERNLEKMEKESTKKWAEFKDNYASWQQLNYEEYSVKELFNLFETRISYGKKNMYLHTDATTAAFSKMAILQWKLKRFNYSQEILLNAVSTLSHVKMAEVSLLIDQLIQKLDENDKKKIIECLSDNEWSHELIKCGYKNVQEFINNSILKNYGHRGKNELEIMEPYWSENPRMLLNIIIDRLNNKNIERQKGKSKDIIYDKKIIPLLEKTRIYTRLRENNKHYLYYIIADIKRIIRIIDKKLCYFIPEIEKNDIYFCTHQELKQLCESPNTFYHIKNQIELRKEIYTRFKNDEESENINIITQKNMLTGIVACQGRTTGIVKVINGDDNSISTGDIIVVKSLDISLTPLFSVAGGVITELGGILSHAAIIAREYGIPTIVNVKQATSILKTGDRVILDAMSGIIHYDTNDLSEKK